MSWGGVYWIPAARFLASPSRVFRRVSGENGVGKLTNCADRRGHAFKGRPAHKSPDFGPTRKLAVSGDIVGGIQKSGFRPPGADRGRPHLLTGFYGGQKRIREEAAEVRGN